MSTSCKSIQILVILCILVVFNSAFRATTTITGATGLRSTLLMKTTSGISRPITLPPNSDDYKWDLGAVAFSLLPLAPGNRRRTLLREIVKDQIWTLDQIQGIINVNVPVRSVIVKLSDGGLFVYNPVAPTKECLKFMRQLEEKHGNVRHIVLGSLGLEHKSLAGPFTRFFKDSTVWLQPGQWSFPVNLPTSLFGFPSGDRLKEIPEKNEGTPWCKDFDHCVLGKLCFKSVGGYGETAFFHRKTKTLILTDAVIKIGDAPSPILSEDPRALLYHSRDTALEEVKDTEESRLRGYRRMTLFSLVFYPSGIATSSVSDAFAAIPKVSPEVKLLGQGSVPISGGLYPWSWTTEETKSFKALQGGLLVAPILQKLIMDREPDRVLDWADRIAQWPIKRIIPSHMENDIKASASDFRRAFSFLESETPSGPRPDEKDFLLLNIVSKLFTTLGIVAPRVPQSLVIRKPALPLKAASPWDFVTSLIQRAA